MALRYGVVLGAAACLLLAGCGKGDKEPKGQVVATVNGDEITVIDLRNEMGNYRAPDAATRKLAERAALEQIIQRKLLVHAAEEAKLDKTPEFAQQKERVEEAFLVKFWQDRVVKSVPPPSKEEIERFVAANPDLYAQRKVFVIDQVRAPMINDRTVIDQMKPLKTLPEITALLASKNIQYQQGQAQMDALTVPPELLAQIMKLPPQEIFVLPQGGILTMNEIRETRVVPVSNDVAQRHAARYLQAQRTQQAVQREFGQALAAARKEKDAVRYAKAYEPTAPKAAAPAKK